MQTPRLWGSSGATPSHVRQRTRSLPNRTWNGVQLMTPSSSCTATTSRAPLSVACHAP